MKMIYEDEIWYYGGPITHIFDEIGTYENKEYNIHKWILNKQKLFYICNGFIITWILHQIIMFYNKGKLLASSKNDPVRH